MYVSKVKKVQHYRNQRATEEMAKRMAVPLFSEINERIRNACR